MHTMPPEPVMYDALVRKDAGFEGVFWLGVRTTGIFCRPTCTARTPRPENVEYFAAARDAVSAGYRACLRCRPLEHDGLSPSWLGRLHAEMHRRGGEPISDEGVLALGVDPGTVRRAFKRRYDMTFQAYQRARRMGLALAAIRDGASLARAAHDHGYTSESGFREAFERTFGTTPGRAGDVQLLHARWMTTRLGPMLGIADDAGLRLLEFTGWRALDRMVQTLRRRLGAVVLPGEHPVLDRAEAQIGAYLEGESTDIDVPSAQLGTDFQQEVWTRLGTIPAGTTLTYSEIASDIGRAGSERAIGNACGANALALVVPCHRAVRSDGGMGGYAGGVWRKRHLLALERSTVAV